MKNYGSFWKSALLLIPAEDKEARKQAQVHMSGFEELVDAKVNAVWVAKMGLKPGGEGGGWDDHAEGMFMELVQLMTASHVDWTIFWRQLTEVAGSVTADDADDDTDASDALLFDLTAGPLSSSFYKLPLSSALASGWENWLGSWADRLRREFTSAGTGGAALTATMKRVSPKYVPREWMLVRAYTAAQEGDYSEVNQVATPTPHTTAHPPHTLPLHTLPLTHIHARAPPHSCTRCSSDRSTSSWGTRRRTM
jgi:uncharacterized protein YdiU (UPF0061 family)